MLRRGSGSELTKNNGIFVEAMMSEEKVIISVLLVEDSVADQQLFQQFLKQSVMTRYSLKIVENLAQANQTLAQKPVDVIVVDLELPDSRGLGTMAQLLEKWPEIPTVVLTGNSDEVMGVNAVKAGAQDYLVKGQINQEVLVRAVRYAVERKQVEVVLQQRAKQQAAIVSLSHEALQERPLDELMDHAVNLVVETLHITGCCITKSAKSQKTQELFANAGITFIKFGKSEAALAQKVFEKNESVYIPDVLTEKEYPIPEWVSHNSITAIQCVVIPDNNETYGVLTAVTNALNQFSTEDVAFLQVVSNVLAEAVQRYKARRGLENALERAKHSELVKNLFLANMSHEIRTPLNTILGFMSLIEVSVEGKIDADEKSFFTLVRESGERLMRTVHEILDIAQIEADTLKLVPIELDILELLKRNLPNWQKMAEAKGLKFTFESDSKRQLFTGDEYCISQACEQIVDNAIKYTDEGGVSITAQNHTEEIVVTIQDTGIGMSEEYLTNLFQAFSQESAGYAKRFQGVGLGLALTKRYLELNEVVIEVTSKQSVGTKIKLIFPKTLKD